MGSKPIETKNNSYNEVPSWLTSGNNQVVGGVINNANQWLNPTAGSLQSNILNTALGGNLNQVNPKEQELFNQQLNSANNAVMRQFAGAGRSNSFSNLDAISKNTANLTNQFLANNYNRNRSSMLNAQQQYFANLMNSQNQALNAINNNSVHVNSQVRPGNSAFQNTLAGVGALASLISALNPLKSS